MTSILRAFIGNIVFANVLLAIIIAAGLLSVSNMKRESMPELKLDIIQIEVSFPGADPEEVEEGISRRIEAAIDGLLGIKEYHTTSQENIAFVEIEVAEDADVSAVRDRVQNAVDSIDTFPAEARRPSYSLVTDREEVIDLALWGDLNERQLKELAYEVRDELQRLPEVSLVNVGDTREYEINIEISRENLQKYGVSIADISKAIQGASLNLSSGAIRTEGQEIRIRAVGRRYTGPDFASVIVKADEQGNRITLDQIANIRDGFTENPAYSTFNGQPSVLIWVEKGPGEDNLRISDAVRDYAVEKQGNLPAGVHITPCFDNADFVRSQISLLTRNGIVGLILVVLILWVFLNTRLSFWISMGIPISLCGCFVILYLLGGTLNQISLVSFIIVLGIIVDDAIVVGEAIFFRRHAGEPPLEAAVAGVREVGMPVLAAVFTTIIAFLPMSFIPGFMGQIIAIMPVVVISALLVSLVECLFLLPAHLSHLPDPNAAKQSSGWQSRLHRYHEAPTHALQQFAQRIYLPIVRRAVEHRYVTSSIAVFTLLVAAGLVGGGHVGVVFWPPVDGETLRAVVEFPPGTPPEVTRDGVVQTRQAFERIAERTDTKSGKDLIQNIYTRVYQTQPHMGRIVIEMPPPSERGVHSHVLAAQWEKEVGVIPGAVQQSFTEDQVGMDGPPINLWLQGSNLDELRAAAAELKDKLRSYDGLFQIGDDFRPGKAELLVKLKPGAAALGLTLQDVAQQLQGGYYGEEALRLQRGPDDVRVRVRYPEEERRTVSGLQDVRIKTPDGHEVPFLSVADVELQQGYASINGSNGLRRVTVTAYADVNRANPSEILAELQEGYLDDLAARYNLIWSVRGVEEVNQQTLAGLKSGFLLAILGIYVIMATIFRSYLQPFLILTIVPFGMVGAVAGHLILGIPITFLSLFGIVALAGVVVNDAIVLIECINNLLSRGMPFYEALCQGGVRRFRAIFLTSASTCVGLMPLILERNLEAQIVIPMAASIAFGVAFATLITLFLLPAMVGILNDGRRLTARLRVGYWPEPEQVEPGTHREPGRLPAIGGNEAPIPVPTSST